ncbi:MULTISPECIES: hypothetical protein [unclassified Inquilinus]|uniref:hypothetical protein n=1 Tax=unclassified Inquilinus TaxID=2645927 RepID=UPI003F8EDC75
MQQAFGSISGSDGSILCGSGNFSVEKTGKGTFTITLQGSSSIPPVVAATPGDQYVTASIVIPSTDGGNGRQPSFNLITGYTDQGSNNPMDIYVVNFIAAWT